MANGFFLISSKGVWIEEYWWAGSYRRSDDEGLKRLDSSSAQPEG